MRLLMLVERVRTWSTCLSEKLTTPDMATIARRWSSLEMQGGRRSTALEEIASLARRAADGSMGRVEKVVRYLAYIGSLSAPLYLVGLAAVAAAIMAVSVG